MSLLTYLISHITSEITGNQFAGLLSGIADDEDAPWSLTVGSAVAIDRGSPDVSPFCPAPRSGDSGGMCTSVHRATTLAAGTRDDRRTARNRQRKPVPYWMTSTALSRSGVHHDTVVRRRRSRRRSRGRGHRHRRRNRRRQRDVARAACGWITAPSGKTFGAASRAERSSARDPDRSWDIRVRG